MVYVFQKHLRGLSTLEYLPTLTITLNCTHAKFEHTHCVCVCICVCEEWDCSHRLLALFIVLAGSLSFLADTSSKEILSEGISKKIGKRVCVVCVFVCVCVCARVCCSRIFSCRT